jgi:Predicted nucleotide-binding protein containing TIR-like domain
MKPSLFIGSSSEKLLYAYALQDQLKSSADVTLWNQGFFALNTSYLESLINGLNDSDFGVFVFAPDDILKLRSETLASVRDNVVFELGLCMGKLGRERAFFVLPEDQGSLRLLTDLHGISTVTYDGARDNIEAALGPACFKILQAIKKSGVRQERLAPPTIEIKIEQERQRVREICARIEGLWWERIPGDGLGFFQVQMDELHNSVRLVQGHFYNETGDHIADWNSVAARITEENDKVEIVYLRGCRVPARNVKEWFHGYGDMYFEGSAEPFSEGHGMFFDVNR